MRTLPTTLFLAALAGACTMPSTATTRTPESGIPIAASTVTVAPSVPTIDEPPAGIPTVTLEPAVTPFVALGVTTAVDNALLRANPGYLFPQIGALRQGTGLLVLGRSPGGEWLLCQTPDHRAGWVFAQLIDAGSGDVKRAPVIWPASAQVVVGRVRDRLGVPISGMQFALVQGAGTQPPRNDAMTDDSGTFYAFMPEDATGTWTVSYTAVSCTSNVMDSSCNCIAGHCGIPEPSTVNIALPRSAQDVLQFSLQ